LKALTFDRNARSAFKRINPDGKTQFTQRQLRQRWGGVTLRTVQRELRRWNGQPFEFIGIMPVFTLGEVERIEAARVAKRSKEIGLNGKNGHVFTVKEAMRLAGRKMKAKR